MESVNFIQKRNLHRNVRAYWVLILIVLTLMSYYSYDKFGELLQKSQAINTQSEILSNLETTLSKEESEYKNLKESKLEEFQQIENSVNGIFPEAENYTNLTRELDNFFLSLSKSNNPIVVSNLQYGGVRLEADSNYSVLPMTLTITATKNNFFKFLDYIEKSGSLQSNVRLMDIQAIKINFNQSEESSAQEVSLSVNMNAYFKNGEEPTT